MEKRKIFVGISMTSVGLLTVCSNKSYNAKLKIFTVASILSSLLTYSNYSKRKSKSSSTPNKSKQTDYTMDHTRKFALLMLAGHGMPALQNHFNQFILPASAPYPKDSLISVSAAEFDGRSMRAYTLLRKVECSFHPRYIDANTQYNVGSFSKVMIMAMIMRMCDAGKVKLEQTVYQLAPEIAKKLPGLNNVTLKNLLSHKSGFRDKTWTRFKRTDPLGSVFAYHEFQGDFYYANYNYSVIGMLIAAITQQSLEQAFATYILKPLNLQHTQFNCQNSDRSNIAFGHVIKSNNEIKIDDLYMYGAVCIYSCPSDINKFLHAFFTNDEFIQPESRKIVLDSVRRQHYEVKTPFAHFQWDADGGMGIERFNYHDGKFHDKSTDGKIKYSQPHGHGGWTNGSSMFAVYEPESNKAYAVTVTKAHVQHQTNTIR